MSKLFYTRPALVVAKDLLGKFLVRRLPGGKLRAGMIVETEAYVGTKDRASHAFGGKHTARNAAEWMAGGHVYIYLVYGMYWQLNISTGREGVPECVLIRALDLAPPLNLPLREGEKNQFPPLSKGRLGGVRNLANGPGKLCRWLKLDKSFYSEDLTKSRRVWVEARGVRVPRSRIMAGPRVGIDYAGQYWAKVPWRFYIKGNAAVSRPQV